MDFLGLANFLDREMTYEERISLLSLGPTLTCSSGILNNNRLVKKSSDNACIYPCTSTNKAGDLCVDCGLEWVVCCLFWEYYYILYRSYDVFMFKKKMVNNSQK